MRKLLPQAGLIRFLDYFEGDGEVLYEQVQRLGLEGIMAKRADSPYRSGRSHDLAQDSNPPDGRFRGGGVQRAQGARVPVSGALISPSTWMES